MNSEQRNIDHDIPARLPRIWGMSCRVWLLVAVFCAFVEWAGSFATNGRVNGWADIVFIAAFAIVGLVALINTIRLARRAG